VIKAEAKGDLELADRVYSSVPARMFGRRQEIEIGHYSGKSNVLHWLRAHGIEATDAVVERVFEAAKNGNRVLEEHEVLALVNAS